MKKKYAFIVKVPKTEKGAYNHDRPISGLIEYQVKHLHDAEISLPERRQTHIDISTLKTELQASRYIQKVMVQLHPKGAPKVNKTKNAKKAVIKPKNSKKHKPARRK